MEIFYFLLFNFPIEKSEMNHYVECEESAFISSANDMI